MKKIILLLICVFLFGCSSKEIKTEINEAKHLSINYPVTNIKALDNEISSYISSHSGDLEWFYQQLQNPDSDFENISYDVFRNAFLDHIVGMYSNDELTDDEYSRYSNISSNDNEVQVDTVPIVANGDVILKVTEGIQTDNINNSSITPVSIDGTPDIGTGNMKYDRIGSNVTLQGCGNTIYEQKYYVSSDGKIVRTFEATKVLNSTGPKE